MQTVITFTTTINHHRIFSRLAIVYELVFPLLTQKPERSSFFKDFIYLFLEGGKEGEKHHCVVVSRVPLLGHDLQPRHVA